MWLSTIWFVIKVIFVSIASATIIGLVGFWSVLITSFLVESSKRASKFLDRLDDYSTFLRNVVVILAISWLFVIFSKMFMISWLQWLFGLLN